MKVGMLLEDKVDVNSFGRVLMFAINRNLPNAAEAAVKAWNLARRELESEDVDENKKRRIEEELALMSK
jgi:hypothetical protein